MSVTLFWDLYIIFEQISHTFHTVFHLVLTINK